MRPEGNKSSSSRPRRPRNRQTKVKVVFNEAARKDFLTGFRKRKDERRQKAKEMLELQLKQEISKVKQEARAKIEKAQKSSSHHVVPEVAHLLKDLDSASTNVSTIGQHSVTVTTLDNLDNITAPWRQTTPSLETEPDEEQEEPEESEDELPGMSCKKPSTAPCATKPVDNKQKKQIHRMAAKQLQKTKAFKAKERIKAKKNRQEARFRKKGLKKKRDRHHNPKKS